MRWALLFVVVGLVGCERVRQKSEAEIYAEVEAEMETARCSAKCYPNAGQLQFIGGGTTWCFCDLTLRVPEQEEHVE